MVTMRKGQSLSLNTIVIAAIVILVLVVLGFIVLRYIGDFSDDIESCEVQQGVCVDRFDGCGKENTDGEDYPVARADISGCSSGKICCMRLS